VNQEPICVQMTPGPDGKPPPCRDTVIGTHPDREALNAPPAAALNFVLPLLMLVVLTALVLLARRRVPRRPALRQAETSDAG